MREISIIRWNDDDHAERVWINGNYVGDMSNPDKIFKALIDIAKKDDFDNYKGICIWGCDEFDKYSKNFDTEEDFKEWVDDMYDWFSNVEFITPKQIELIEQSKLNELYNE